MMVSASVAINLLTSLELDRNVPVNVTQGVLKIGLCFVRPPLFVPHHYHLLYYPLFVLRQQENGSMT